MLLVSVNLQDGETRRDCGFTNENKVQSQLHILLIFSSLKLLVLLVMAIMTNMAVIMANKHFLVAFILC
jgi:hypothetical protein